MPFTRVVSKGLESPLLRTGLCCREDLQVLVTKGSSVVPSTVGEGKAQSILEYQPRVSSSRSTAWPEWERCVWVRYACRCRTVSVFCLGAACNMRASGGNHGLLHRRDLVSRHPGVRVAAPRGSTTSVVSVRLVKVHGSSGSRQEVSSGMWCPKVGNPPSEQRALGVRKSGHKSTLNVARGRVGKLRS